MSSRETQNTTLTAGNPAYSQEVRAPRILVVDDNPDMLRLISLRLKPYSYDLQLVGSAEEALSAMSVMSMDLVITDVRLPGQSGMDLFRQIKRTNPLLPVIVITAHGTIQDAVTATQSGVVSYLTKPFDSNELLDKIQAGLLRSGFSDPTQEKVSVTCGGDWRDGITSNSPAMKSVLAELEKLCNSDNLVVIEGEYGTGKTRIANTIHSRSHRHQGPIEEVNCINPSAKKLERELFGHVAKDGTVRTQSKLLSANGGSIIFREFDEAPVPILYRLVKALISGTASPVGSKQHYRFNVRAIATSPNMEPTKKPHDQLWSYAYELGMTIVRIPPLRERREDIPFLATRFLVDYDKGRTLQFSTRALRLLSSAAWPGNLLQLKAIVTQCAELTTTSIISEELVKTRLTSPVNVIETLNEAQSRFEREYLINLLKMTLGNVTKAARLAKRNRTEMHRLLKKHAIEAKTFRNKA